jgi:hypothetical protein
VVAGVTNDGCRLEHGDFNGPDKFAAWGYFEGTQRITNSSAGPRRPALRLRLGPLRGLYHDGGLRVRFAN